MTVMTAEPHLVVQFCEDDEIEGDSEWVDYRTYHIASPDAGSNNVYVGEQINSLLSCVEENPELWWRIVYVEHKQISTTSGTMNLGKTSFAVTDNCKNGVHVEEFLDRNSDGYYELNHGMPIYEQYPRFWTEHDYPVDVAGGEEPEGLRVGDHVKVSSEPKTAQGGIVSEAFYGQVVRVIGKGDSAGNWVVQLPSGRTNFIGEEYLTKVNADGSPINEEKKDEEFKAGEDVEGEDEPDDTIHVSDGDVITVFDEFGHEKTMRISVV